MKVSMGAPGYMPGPIFFQKIGFSDAFVFLDKKQTKKEYTRTSLKTPRGRIVLTIPIKERKGQLLKETELQNKKWLKQHWDCINLSYKGCKYHEILEDFKDFFLLREWNNLSVFNIKTIKKISRILGFDKVKFYRESQFEGKDILEELDGRSIDCNFCSRPYPQLHGGFLPGMSILDYIFNCGGRGKYDLRVYFSD